MNLYKIWKGKKKNEYLSRCLKEDNIEIEDIINFKKYNIVDNEHPKVCADRLDRVILTVISWTKNVDYEDINNIINGIPSINLSNVKIRELNPLVKGKRIK